MSLYKLIINKKKQGLTEDELEKYGYSLSAKRSTSQKGRMKFGMGTRGHRRFTSSARTRRISY